MMTKAVVRMLSSGLMLACMALPATPWLAGAQTTTARITGTVTGEGGVPVPEALVSARSPATNFTRNARTSEQGIYTLPGLPPDNYEITVQRIGQEPQRRQVRAQIGQTLTVNFVLSTAAVQLTTVQVTAGADEIETRTPELATNITTEQIENIPLNNRNFLNLAKLAPGVRADGGSISSGALSADNINVFVDGASYKNDILRGGVAGQDASKGNPFPQNAVQEFRVITQQYKAEYQKATSAIITATTKSGTNEFEGSLFVNGQTDAMISNDFFFNQRCDQAKQNGEPCEAEPELKFWQAGGSVGGPIVRDKLFFFGSYEGNLQNRASLVSLGDVTSVPTTLVDSLNQFTGTHTSPFRSHLFFGKLTYTPEPESPHRTELSFNGRTEYDIRNFGNQDSYENAEDFHNDVYTGIAKHQYAQGNLLNESILSYQRYTWNPKPLETTIGVNYRDILKVGGRCCLQDRTQDRIALRNDVTYTVPDLAGSHTFKGGATVDFVRYDVTFTRAAVPQFTFVRPNFDFPSEADFGTGNPRVLTNNSQIGAYFQDDWSLNNKLTLNLGVRWDYETNMINNRYVTPDSAVNALRTYATTLPCNDASEPDYKKLLCNPDQYISTGNNRDPFMAAFQPRVGFSYDVRGNGRTTLFGGVGIYYDRLSQADVYDEPYRQQYAVYTFRFSPNGEPLPNGNPTIAWNPSYMSAAGLQGILNSGDAPKPELWAVKNDTRPPKSYQGTIGVRQTFARDYLVSLNYTGVRGYNFTTYFIGNLNENGTCCNQDATEDFSNIIISDDVGKNWYDAMYLTLEKRYREGSKWGGQIAYTLGKAETTAEDLIVGFDFPAPSNLTRYPSRSDERHHVTTNWIVGLPWEFRFSGIIDLGSGRPYNARFGGDACTTGNQDCISNDYPSGKGRNSARPDKESFILPNMWAFRNVDLRLEKEFATLRGQRVGLSASVFNVFDFDNFECYGEIIGDLQPDGSVVPNSQFGKPTCTITDPLRSGTPRRFQFGLDYDF